MSDKLAHTVVKVQQSLFPEKGKRVLVYDKARTLFFESGDPKVIDPLIKQLGEEPKKYFNASVEGTDFKIFDEVKDLTW